MSFSGKLFVALIMLAGSLGYAQTATVNVHTNRQVLGVGTPNSLLSQIFPGQIAQEVYTTPEGFLVGETQNQVSFYEPVCYISHSLTGRIAREWCEYSTWKGGVLVHRVIEGAPARALSDLVMEYNGYENTGPFGLNIFKKRTMPRVKEISCFLPSTDLNNESVTDDGVTCLHFILSENDQNSWLIQDPAMQNQPWVHPRDRQ